jgi:predicted neutral ceramidase superfamily lipid hydrolase
MQKSYQEIITARPSTFVIAAITIAASIFLLGGGIYDLLEKPLIAIVQSGGSIIVYYPYDINDQFLLESIVVMVGYVMGVVGLLLTYQSTKYAYKPRQAYMLLLMGCILLIGSYIFIEHSLLTRFG